MYVASANLGTRLCNFFDQTRKILKVKKILVLLQSELSNMFQQLEVGRALHIWRNQSQERNFCHFALSAIIAYERTVLELEQHSYRKNQRKCKRNRATIYKNRRKKHPNQTSILAWKYFSPIICFPAHFLYFLLFELRLLNLSWKKIKACKRGTQARKTKTWTIFDRIIYVNLNIYVTSNGHWPRSAALRQKHTEASSIYAYLCAITSIQHSTPWIQIIYLSNTVCLNFSACTTNVIFFTDGESDDNCHPVFSWHIVHWKKNCEIMRPLPSRIHSSCSWSNWNANQLI